MNQEDVIRMAREAGARACQNKNCDVEYLFSVEQIDRLLAAERNKLAVWMIQFGFATGHGDTMEQLVDALGSEIVDRIEFEIDVATRTKDKP